MRNLKRFLAVVVTIAMVAMFSISAFAAVPSDVKGTEFEAAATRLIALGILTGYPDGTFGPNDTITRAQFAAVVVRALGLEDSAKAATGQTKFADVGATYWAAGYINMATSLKVINGYPNGKFGPEDKVTYEQAVAMVMRALGYSPKAETLGGYPSGYLVVANDEDVTKGINGVAGTPAPRGLVAKLVDNALETPLMIQVGYGTEIKYVKSGEEDTDEQTLLDTKLKLDVYEATVLSTGDKLEVRYTNSSDNDADIRGTKEKLNVFETVSQVGLEDAIVTLWVKDGMVYNIKTDSTVYYDVISEINGEDDTANIDTFGDITDITLKNADANLDVDTDAGWSAEIDENGQVNTDSADPLLNKFAKVVVDDGKVVKIYAYNMREAGLVTAISDSTIEYTKGNDEGLKIRKLDDADSILAVLNGKAVEYSDLAVGQYFEIFDNGDDDYVIAATDAKIEGTLNRAKLDEIQIDGEYTDLSNSYFVSDDNGDEYTGPATPEEDTFNDYLKTDVTAYLDLAGDIKYVKGNVEETTDSFYGFVVNTSDYNKEIRVAKVVDGEVKEVNYDTDLDDPDATNPDDLTFAQITARSLQTAVGAGGDTDNATDLQRIAALSEFTVDADGVITLVEQRSSGSNLVNVDFNDDSDLIDGSTDLYMDDDVPVFEVTTGRDIDVYVWSDIRGTTTNTVDAYYFGDATPDAVLLDDKGIVNGTTTAFGTSDEFLGFVTDRSSDSKDDWSYDLATATADGDQTFLVDKDDDSNAVEDGIVVYKPVSDGRAEIVATAAYDNLNPINAYDSDYTVTNLVTIDADSIDGKTFTTGAGTMHRLAANAQVVEKDGDDYYTGGSLADIDDETAGGRAQVAFVEKDGLVQLVIYINP